ncbi:ABC transporter ATP-binding protein [Micromonospora lupini]|uniref:ABC transporter ATP-binding protein n=1 Tax=Micromonospora lupini TaxID=285679 RepID=UPI0033E67C3B
MKRVFTLGETWRAKSRPRVALDGVNLRLAEGEAHGLLGPNGAGKTTLVKILATILLPTAGSVKVLGHDVRQDPVAVRRQIGLVLGGERGLYFRLTARENLGFWAALHGMTGRAARKRCDELLDRFGLLDRADAAVETYSRGMKQRLHLARGLLGNPQVLILDEPTIGMDPVATRDFREQLRGLHAEGRTILLTTHDMVEAETLCDRVSLIDRGRILATEPPRALGGILHALEYVDVEGAPQWLLDDIALISGVREVSALPVGVRIKTSSAETTGVVLRSLVDAGVTAVRTGRPTLEEVYMNVFGARGVTV